MLAIRKSVPMATRAVSEAGFVFIKIWFAISKSDGFRFRTPPRKEN